MKTKQYIVIGSVVVLMGVLLSLDIKGLVKAEEDSTEMPAGETGASASSTTVSATSVALVAKQNVNASLVADIEKLENKIKNASDSEIVELQKELAQKWDDVNQPAPAAFASEAVAEKQSNYTNWLKRSEERRVGKECRSRRSTIR